MLPAVAVRLPGVVDLLGRVCCLAARTACSAAETAEIVPTVAVKTVCSAAVATAVCQTEVSDAGQLSAAAAGAIRSAAVARPAAPAAEIELCLQYEAAVRSVHWTLAIAADPAHVVVAEIQSWVYVLESSDHVYVQQGAYPTAAWMVASPCGAETPGYSAAALHPCCWSVDVWHAQKTALHYHQLLAGEMDQVKPGVADAPAHLDVAGGQVQRQLLLYAAARHLQTSALRCA